MIDEREEREREREYWARLVPMQRAKHEAFAVGRLRCFTCMVLRAKMDPEPLPLWPELDQG